MGQIQLQADLSGRDIPPPQSDPDGANRPEAGGPEAVRRLGIALLAYTLFRLALGVIRLPPGTPEWSLFPIFVVTAFGGIGLPIFAICALIRGTRTAGAALLIGLAGLVLWLGLGAGGRWIPPAFYPLLGTLQDLGKILAAAGVGVALASLLREPNILLPAGTFAAFADFVVVNFGTVKHALAPGNQKGQALVQAVSAQLPAMHARLPTLTVGPADFLFLGVFLACAARFDFGVRRNAWILAVVLAVSLVLVPFIGNVPALAPMSIAFVVANCRRFRLTRDEILGTVAVLVVMGGLFVAYFLFLFPTKK